MEIGAYAKKLIEVIDELYLYQAGPLGSFICEEALEKWASSQKQARHTQLDDYVAILIDELPDNKQKKAFVDNLRQAEQVKLHAQIQKLLDNYQF